MVVSFFQSILIIQPLKVQWRKEFYTQKKACNLKLAILSSQVVFLAIFFALVIKKVDEEDYQHMVVVENDSHPGRRSWKCLFQGLIFGILNWIALWKQLISLQVNARIHRRSDRAAVCISLLLQQTLREWERTRSSNRKSLPFWGSFWVSSSVFLLFHSRIETDPEARLSGFSQRTLFVAVHIGFMWMLLLVAYSQRDPNAYFLQNHIKKSFSSNIADSMSLGDIFAWANTALLRNLFGQYSGDALCCFCSPNIIYFFFIYIVYMLLLFNSALLVFYLFWKM